ncbi:MAG: outer membrane beta-barrel protein [Bacteroidaceae bacterium]|nr:outer membrane beta-barrel protein [Bacteroidaceae bacterium]
MAGLCYRSIQVSVLGVFFVLFGSLRDVEAQVMSVDYDWKILYTDSMQMPKNTSLGTVLMILPELLGRPGDDLISNYDILIEGMSVFDAKDAALTQLRLGDVERIEVSESPTSSYQNNGQGGVVNFALRRKDNAIWGSAALEGSYSTDIMPALTFGYAKGKWLVRALALGEYYRPYSDVAEWNMNIETGACSDIRFTREKMSSWGELARVYAQCNISDKDVLAWNLGEYSSRTSQEQYHVATNVKIGSQYQSNTTLQTLLNYSHVVNSRSSLSAEVQYVYSPSSDGFEQDDYFVDHRNRMLDNHTTSHNVNSKLEYQANLFPVKDGKSCGLTIGLTGNGLFTRGNVIFEDRTIKELKELYAPRYNTYYLMPYAKIKMQAGKLRLSLAGEFQHLRTSIHPGRLDVPDEDYTNIANDLTCKMIGEWHFNSSQCLRLIVDRKLKRPDKVQIYPVNVFNPEKYMYVKGNSELKPEGVIQLGVDYISNYRWGNHSLQMSLAANYYHVSDLIVEYTAGGNEDLDGIGMTLRYLTYKNDGHSNILAGGAMAVWKYRWMQFSAAACVFHNKQEADGTVNHYTYYNISLQPSLSLPRNWGIVSHFVYNSRVTRVNQYLGESASIDVNLDKTWRNWSVYVFGSVSLFGKTTDASVSDGVVNYREYPQVRSGGGAGVRYVF